MSYQIAIQMFSVRREFDEDPVGTLKKLREIGFTAVEMAGYNGLPVAYFKGILDTLGMTAVSGHLSKETVEENPRRIIDELRMLGSSYLAIPYLEGPFHPGGARFHEAIKFFNNTGKLFKENGIQLLYHNHEHEFAYKTNGDYNLDVLYNSVDPEYLMAEIDTCWSSYKKVDTPRYLAKFKGRLPVVHLKDFIWCKPGEKGTCRKDIKTCSIGEGDLDMKAIVDAAKKAGATVFVIEQDEPIGELDIFECLKIGFDNLSALLAD